MRIDLARRATELVELMDDPGCDPVLLDATYARFATVNRLVSGWRGLYRSHIRPRLDPSRTTTILDIGFGGGDVPSAIASWARADGLPVRVTAIDPDERSVAFARRRYADGPVDFRSAHSSDLVAQGDQVDIVLSNHVLHHLDPAQLAGLLSDSASIARGLVLHSDLERDRLAYAAYGLVTLPGRRRSFLHVDGLRSIRRSYRQPELQEVVPDGWLVERRFPMRLLLSRRFDATADERR
jgi:2-polyprenyl-3-methyl-5-hydroxy-6-metoxy-1,4-benzoquinol methylase